MAIWLCEERFIFILLQIKYVLYLIYNMFFMEHI